MNVSFVRRAYSPSGGAEKYLLRLAEAMHRQGIQPELVTASEWPKAVWKWKNPKLIKGATPIEFADHFKKIRPELETQCSFSLERVWEADIYRAGDGVHAAWLERLKNHSSAISSFFRSIKSKHKQILDLERSLYRPESNTKIIANSKLVAEEIKSHFNTPENRIKVIYNGYSPRQVSTEEALEIRSTTRKELALGDDQIAILFVGSGWKRKGLHYLAEAVKQLDSNIQLIVAGKGKPLIKAPNIKYLGVSNKITELCIASDLFCLPTLYDPFSNACLEAASYGLPVITTKDNGFSEAISQFGGGSVIQDASSIQEILKHLNQWLDPDKRLAAKSSLQDLTDHHTIERNLTETLDFINSRSSS